MSPWLRQVHIRQDLHSFSSVCFSAQEFETVTGLPKLLHHYLYLDGDVCVDAEEFGKLVPWFYADRSRVEHAQQVIERICQEWVDFAHTLSSYLSDQEAYAAFAQEYKKIYGMTAPLILGSEGACRKRGEDILKRRGHTHTEEALALLAVSPYETQIGEEKRALLDLAIRVQRGESIEGDLALHAERFGHLGYIFFQGGNFDTEIYRARLQEWMRKDPAREKQRLEAHRQESLAQARVLISSLELTADEHAWIKALQYGVWLRTRRLEQMHLGMKYVRPLLERIASLLHISYDALLYLTPAEVQEGLKGKGLPSDHLLRMQAFGCKADGKSMVIVTGSELDTWKTDQSEKTDQVAHDVKGIGTSPGVVQGVVRLCLKREELSRVQLGDILVTRMTTPDFVIAMEKSAAIVTDIGGLTCHAAIVSRELGKPCVIGTKIATQVLKDGDRVEVDANVGIIRKLPSL